MEGASTGVARQLVALGREVVDGLRGHDLALISAGVTYYAAIALVPGVLVAISLIGLLLGEARAHELGSSLAEALPGGLGAPAVVDTAFQAATTMSPLVVAGAAVPATFYGEGLRRAFVRLAGQREDLVGWRGRLSVLPLLAAAPVLLLPVLLVTPVLARLFADSGLSAALGVVVAFTVDWLVLTATLTFVYRVVGPGRPAWAATLCAAGATGSFVAGFVQGFVLFLSFTLDLGLPFGGFRPVGAAVAVGFWLFLLHLIVLVGYGLALRLGEHDGGSVSLRRLVPSIRHRKRVRAAGTQSCRRNSEEARCARARTRPTGPGTSSTGQAGASRPRPSRSSVRSRPAAVGPGLSARITRSTRSRTRRGR